MKQSVKNSFHILFEASAIVKAIDSIVEIALGLFFFVASTVTVNGVIFWLTGNELTEEPRDWLTQLIFRNWNGFSGHAQIFWGIVFVGNGILKMVLVLALFKKKFEAYPIIAAVFAALAVYQIYHLVNFPSLALSVLTVFDIIFIALIVQEYRFQKEKIN